MPKDFSKFKTIVVIFILCCTSSVHAEPFHENILALMIKGDVEAVVKTIEAEKDFNWNQNKIKLGELNSEYYSIALIVLGEIDKASKFLGQARKHHPKYQALKDIQKHINFYQRDYTKANLDFSKEESKHIEIIKLMPEYIKASIINPKQAKKLKKKIRKLIKHVSNRQPYFMTKLEYLMELKDKDSNAEAEKLALEVIKTNRNKLFPKTLEFYELAMAYKVLGILSLKAQKLEQARNYLKLAQDNIYKMRALWLEEDIIIDHPILKTHERHTEFGFLVPQWIMLLRQEFDNYLTSK